MRYLLVACIACLVMMPAAQAVSQHTLTQQYGSYLKAFIHFEEGDFEESLKDFENVRRIDPDSIFVRLKIAFLLVKMGELQQAESELKDIQKIDPQNLEASLGLIFLYSHQGDEAKLEKEYGSFLEKAHLLRPQDTKISEYLAQFYFYKKKYEDAIKLYEAMVKADPDDTDTRYLLGYFYEENGQREKAVQEWKRVLKKDAGHADALNSLGYIYAEEGTSLDEAEAMVIKALKQDEDNGAYLDSLGWIYFKKGDYPKAEGYLLKAAGSIQDPVVYEHLGELYIKMDSIQKAIMYFQKGLDIDPGNKALQKKITLYEEENTPSEETDEQSTEADH